VHDGEFITATRPATQAGPDTHDQRLTAGLATAGAMLGGIGFLYGAATATQRYGLTPWKLLAAYLALAAGLAGAAYLLNRSAKPTPAASTTAARIRQAVIARLNFGSLEAIVVVALAVPWLDFAGYGLIQLAQG
jgi:hypothetical protein